MATYTEFNIDQGQTFSTTITLSNDITNADINLASYTIKSQLRYSYYAKNVADSFTCTVSDAANGIVTISMPSSNTANLKAGRYYFDVFSISPSPANVAIKVLEGITTIFPSVTSLS